MSEFKVYEVNGGEVESLQDDFGARIRGMITAFQESEVSDSELWEGLCAEFCSVSENQVSFVDSDVMVGYVMSQLAEGEQFERLLDSSLIPYVLRTADRLSKGAKFEMPAFLELVNTFELGWNDLAELKCDQVKKLHEVMPNLSKFVLNGVCHGDKSKLSLLGLMDWLSCLDIQDDSNLRDLNFLIGMKSLKEVSLKRVAGLKDIGVLNHLPSLEKVELSGVRIEANYLSGAELANVAQNVELYVNGELYVGS